VTDGRAPHWLLFGGLAAAVVAADQLTKAWVAAAIEPGQAIRVVGDELRLIITYNTGGLFGLFRDQAAIFAAFSVAVMALIVVVHARSTPGRYISVTLGFLLGGAIGNFIDRVRFGHVVDFVDGGIGNLRFYTFNVADMAVTASVLLLIGIALRSSWPRRVPGGHGAP
jgi:signal peptidase II